MRARLAGTSAAERWTGIRTFFEDYVPEHRFDVVLATYVLEHVTDPALILRLAQTTWLEPGGVLAVAVPNGFSLHRRLAVKMGLASRPDELGEGDRRIGHKHCFTPDEMGQLLEDCGFEVTEQFGMITKALPNGLLAGCNDAQLKGLFQLGVDLPMEYSGAIGFIAKKKN
jgi:2-polyprenyl-3-methyl-5-hydroxy-6-metoxy-1,4-benzoquinol methylase